MGAGGGLENQIKEAEWLRRFEAQGASACRLKGGFGFRVYGVEGLGV